MTDSQVLLRYVYPNGFSPLIVQCTFVVASAIITEASLSFLGAGVDPEIPTWGNMLCDGQRVLQSAWWLALFLGIALVLAVLTLNLLVMRCGTRSTRGHAVGKSPTMGDANK